MARTLYLVNPNCDFPTYFGGDVYGAKVRAPAVFVGDLAVVTVAALAPPQIDVKICDEGVTPVDFDVDAEWVGITGKVTQWGRMRAIADEFRKRGKTVIIGGPFASLSPSTVRPHCDILVRGEFEGIAAGFFADLLAGRARREYQGNKPDLATSPVPRWDLYPNAQTALGCVQTSRGCPFECEFCDVIQYLDRKQRHKKPEQVIRELEVLYQHGYREVFLADDNFTVYRSRAKELLAALKEWNAGLTAGKMTFTTQVSIDAAMDDDLLSMCAQAGLTFVFIGIETINEASLAESKKRQNVGVDLRARIRKFVEHGICVMGGLIVGFDHDTRDIFQMQADFVNSVPVPIFSLGPLVAPEATPLYARLEKAGRLEPEASQTGASPFDTNIRPMNMSREELLEGVRWLCNTIYSPENFEKRMMMMIEQMGPRKDPVGTSPDSPRRQGFVHDASRRLLMDLTTAGPSFARMCTNVFKAVASKREAADLAVPMLVRYAQVRHMYERAGFWTS